MKKNKQLFCKLMAGGIYTAGRAVELSYGVDEFEDANAQGEYLLANKKIVKRIADETAGIAKMNEASSSWIKGKLVEMVERESNSAISDPNVIRYSLDMINKMDGNYNDDGSGGVPVVLKMTF